MKPKSKIMQKVIEHFGSQTELAAKLGITIQHVNGWCRERTSIPVIQAFKIEKLTRGKFKASQLINDEMKKYIK